MQRKALKHTWSRPRAGNGAALVRRAKTPIRRRSVAFAKRNCERPQPSSASVKSPSWAMRDGAVDQVDSTIAIRAIVEHIRRVRPHVVITFGPDGAYGHPDHIAISQFTTAAIVCAGDAGYSSDSLPAHRVAKLYNMAWRNDKWEAYQAAFRKLTSMVDGVARQANPWPDWASNNRDRHLRLLARRLESGVLPPDPNIHLRAA